MAKHGKPTSEMLSLDKQSSNFTALASTAITECAYRLNLIGMNYNIWERKRPCFQANQNIARATMLHRTVTRTAYHLLTTPRHLRCDDSDQATPVNSILL